MDVSLVGSDIRVTKNQPDLFCCCNTVIEEIIDLRKVHKISRYTPSCWRNFLFCCIPWLYNEGVELAYGPSSSDRLFISTPNSRQVMNTLKARLDGMNS